jgi:hypothetical protein
MDEEAHPKYPVTPDGRYFVVRGRLWRCSNPAINEARRDQLVRKLMAARRLLRDFPLGAEGTAAHQHVDDAKRALGERGPVWWADGAPDYNRRMAKNTPYADWFESLGSVESEY